MNIILNGQPTEVAARRTVAELILDLDLRDKRVAVAVNRQVVPKGRHAATELSEGDRVEILHAVAGG